MNVLVINDDGIDSPGLFELVKALKKIANVDVVAPSKQQSAVGHALTIESPLRAVPYYINGVEFGTSVNGTPSDCVKLALSKLLDYRPDILISGINFGKNTSVNILYSGTVAAAVEGMLAGIPSIAVSLDSFTHNSDTSPAADYTVKLASNIKSLNLPKDTLLNINVPAISKEKIKGVKITRLSNSVWKDDYEKRQDPFGRDYYWFSGEYQIDDNDIESDDIAIQNGYISLTPLQINFSNPKINDILKKINCLFNNNS